MIKAWLSCLAILAAFCLCIPTTAQDDIYTLGFAGPESIVDTPESTVTETYQCTLQHEGPGPGAQGFSISVTSDNALITAIRDGVNDEADTDTGEQYSGGFAKTETTPGEGSVDDCEGKPGAVSGVVLSFVENKILPPSAVILELDVEVTLPLAGETDTATLRYADGCKGAGQPVENNVTQEGNSIPPIFETLDITLEGAVGPVDCCQADFIVGFSGSVATESAANTNIVGLGDLCNANEGTIAAAGADTQVFASVSSQPADGVGVQGWSVSIEAFDDVDITAVTSEGTPGKTKQSGGFEKTEVVDPAAPENNGRRGCVSAVVLSFVEDIVLDVPGTESILDMTVAPTVAPAGDESVSGSLAYRDGLKGSGQPVNNVLTVAGASGPVCNFFDAEVIVSFAGKPPAKVFLRGDANDDGKVNIADPVWILNWKFREGPASDCESAADGNDDGGVDLADAVYIIEYRFLGGPVPPAPFPACGEEDAEDDDLPCDAGSYTSCN